MENTTTPIPPPATVGTTGHSAKRVVIIVALLVIIAFLCAVAYQMFMATSPVEEGQQAANTSPESSASNPVKDQIPESSPTSANPIGDTYKNPFQ